MSENFGRRLQAVAASGLRRWLEVHCWVIYVREIDGASADVEISPGTEYELVDDGYATTLAELSPYLSLKEIDDAFSRGDQCVVARREGADVAYTWRTVLDSQVIEGVGMRLVEDGTFMGLGTWVSPAARGARIFAGMRTFFDTISTASGLNQGVSYANVENWSSRKSLEREATARYVGWVVHAAWGAAAWSLVNAGARRWVEIVKGDS